MADERTPGARLADRRLAWSMIVLFVIDFALTGAMLIYLSRHIDATEHQVRTSCTFFRHLASFPVTAPGVKHPPSVTVVLLLVDARGTYRGIKCEPALPPPDPTLAKWARFYHLPTG